jgi:hypothetical protein
MQGPVFFVVVVEGVGDTPKLILFTLTVAVACL